MFPQFITIFCAAIYFTSSVLALPYSPRQNNQYLAARHEDLVSRADQWGSGKYTVDLEVYHTSLKPLLLSKFKAKFGRQFPYACGNNPDFHIELNGNVYPSATEPNAKAAGKCKKQTFTLPLGPLVLQYVGQKPRRRALDSEVLVKA